MLVFSSITYFISTIPFIFLLQIGDRISHLLKSLSSDGKSNAMRLIQAVI
jgi:hypothetical protein